MKSELVRASPASILEFFIVTTRNTNTRLA
jgi:hypothetical protein